MKKVFIVQRILSYDGNGPLYHSRSAEELIVRVFDSELKAKTYIRDEIEKILNLVAKEAGIRFDREYYIDKAPSIDEIREYDYVMYKDMFGARSGYRYQGYILR